MAESLATLVPRVSPVALSREQRLPVPEALASVLPGGGLRRGSVVGVEGPGATSLLWALLGPPTATGSWVALVGMASAGLAAAAEAGVALERLAVVAAPGEAWTTVLASLLDGFDVVVTASDRRLRPTDARRLTARARERGTVVVLTGGWARSWPEGPDLALTVADPVWEGLGRGHGHLQRRRVHLEATGRGEAARPRSADLWLPADDAPVLEAHDLLLAPDLPPLTGESGARTGEDPVRVAS